MKDYSSTDWNSLVNENAIDDDSFIDEILNDKRHKAKKKGIPVNYSSEAQVQTKETKRNSPEKKRNEHERNAKKVERFQMSLRSSNDGRSTSKDKGFTNDMRPTFDEEDSDDIEMDLKHDLITVRQLNEELRTKLAETETYQLELKTLKEKHFEELKDLKKKLKSKTSKETEALKEELKIANQKIEDFGTRVKTLTEENEKLRKEVDILKSESHRIPPTPIIPQRFGNSYISDRYPNTTTMTELGRSNRNAFENLKIVATGISNIDDYIQERRYPGDRCERLYPNGAKLTVYGNGDVKEEFANGQIIIHRNNRKFTADNLTGCFNGCSVNDDVVQVYQYPNGQIERLFSNGLYEITFPDKTVKTKYPNGKYEIKYCDGLTEIFDPFGGRKIIYPSSKRISDY